MTMEARKKMSDSRIVHGYTSRRIRRTDANRSTYRIWRGIIQRCCDPNCQAFNDYGGRGIHVCEKWREFLGFLDDMGERPPKLSIDRINNDGNYCKDNCRWATVKDQQNNKRSNKRFEWEGVIYTQQQLAERYRISPKRLSDRLRRGWNLRAALFSPLWSKIC